MATLFFVTKMASKVRKSLSWGLGLRPQFHQDLAQDITPALHLELMADNYFDHLGGPLLEWTYRLAEKHPLLLHSVGLNIGSFDPIDHDYVSRIKKLIKCFKISVYSDHLCFTRSSGKSTFELLPIKKNNSELHRISQRVNEVQDLLGHKIALENPSAYINYRSEQMSDLEFLMELHHRTGCGILFDVNNLYVNAFNFQFDARKEIDILLPEAVDQIHVAGHTKRANYLFDTHDTDVHQEVWKLLNYFLNKLSPKNSILPPIVLECDDPNQTLKPLLTEIESAQKALAGEAS
jgi:uncharacterized protein